MGLPPSKLKCPMRLLGAWPLLEIKEINFVIKIFFSKCYLTNKRTFKVLLRFSGFSLIVNILLYLESKIAYEH